MPQQPSRVPVSDLTAEELRERAYTYRKIAGAARVPFGHVGLLKLAERFDATADAREQESPEA